MKLCWAAQGEVASDSVTGATRTAPSAGAAQPLELFVLQNQRLSRYFPELNSLKQWGEVDAGKLAEAALNQDFIKSAPAVFVIAAEVGRTTSRYGERGERYVSMEAGHAAQNLLLEATVLGLGGVPVGAFDDAEVARALGLPERLIPLYIIPVGRAAAP